MSLPPEFRFTFWVPRGGLIRCGGWGMGRTTGFCEVLFGTGEIAGFDLEGSVRLL